MSQLTRDDVRLKIKDGHPLLVVGDTELLLRTFLETGDDSYSAFGEHTDLSAEVECDGDNGCWFTMTGDDLFPMVSIQPQLLEQEES